MSIRPHISLITDFGYDSPFVGVMKAVILSRCSAVKIIDVFHGVTAYNSDEAGFWLAHTYHYLPDHTIHLAVVDPGVGSNRKILAAQYKKHLFLAPDNGLLDQGFRGATDIKYRVLDINILKQHLKLNSISHTFHGRDIFAPVAAALATGNCTFEELGPAVSDIVLSQFAGVEQQGDITYGSVMSVDHYGNLLTNIKLDMLSEYKKAWVLCEGQQFSFKKTYSDGAEGECIALINSFGVLEIACVQGHAANKLGITSGAKIELRLNSL